MSVVTPVLLASVGNTKPTIRWKKLREANVHHHQQQGLNRTLEAKKKVFCSRLHSRQRGTEREWERKREQKAALIGDQDI